MNVIVRSHGFLPKAPALRYVEEKIGRALDSYRDRVLKVRVFLKDINGPKGGVDKAALVQVHLDTRQTVTVESRNADLKAAISLAVRRTRRSVSRAVDRRRRIRRDTVRGSA